MQCNLTTSQHGLTMLELLITIVILALIMLISAPSFKDMVQRDRVAASSNQILMAINFARTQAITRNKRVTLCPSTDLKSCIATPSATDWSNQWIVFTDSGTSDGDGTIGVFDTLATTPDPSDSSLWEEELLRVYDALPDQDYIYADEAIRPFISFIGDGSPRDKNYIELNTEKSRFAYCPQQKASSDARVISISRAGRAVIAVYNENNLADKTFITGICNK